MNSSFDCWVLRAKIGGNYKTFDCPDCGEKFAFQKRFKQHKRKHIKKEAMGTGIKLKGDFLCQPCDSIFDGKLLYEQHKIIHMQNVLGKSEAESSSNEDKNMCPKCEKVFKLAKNFLIHQTKGSCRYPQDTMKYSCDVCDYEGSQKYILILHKNVKHNGVKFKCDKCGFESTYMTSIKRHMQKIHLTIIDVSDRAKYLSS